MGAPEQPLSDKDVFDAIALKISNITGVQLGIRQSSLVLSRLTKHLRTLGGLTPQEYWDYLETNTEQEIPVLISLLTTHHTFFFREQAHFDYLERELVQVIKRLKEKGKKSLRIWCAACSRGQEGYSIAMFLDYHLKQIASNFDYTILFSDVDGQSVRIAKEASYPQSDLSKIPLKYRSNHWVRVQGQDVEFAKAKTSLLKHCEFRTINLLHLDKMVRGEPYDIIFCRNVFIYFKPREVERISAQLLSMLDDQGLLIVGISESLIGMKLPMQLVGRSIYRKLGKGTAAPLKIDSALPPSARALLLPKIATEAVPSHKGASLHSLADQALKDLRKRLKRDFPIQDPQKPSSTMTTAATHKSEPLTASTIKDAGQKRIITIQKTLNIGFHVRRILNQIPDMKSVGFEVIATAAEGIQRIQDKKAEILLADASVATFLPEIIAKCRIPVLLVSPPQSQLRQDQNLQNIRFISYLEHDFHMEEPGQLEILRQALGRLHNADIHVTRNETKETSLDFDAQALIAIGASTGGTEALAHIISELPGGMPPIVIVQHIPEGFSRAFAERLHQNSRLRVREASNNDTLGVGDVLVAPGNRHMEVLGRPGHYRVKVFDGEKISGHKPSVDVLFSSVAKQPKGRIVGLILTGMGSDGAKGLLAMRQRGAITLGQDERSSIVYGMPKVAFQIGAVQRVLALEGIAQELIKAVRREDKQGE